MEALLPPTRALPGGMGNALPNGGAHVALGPAVPRDFCCALDCLPGETAALGAWPRSRGALLFAATTPGSSRRALGLFPRLSLSRCRAHPRKSAVGVSMLLKTKRILHCCSVARLIPFLVSAAYIFPHTSHRTFAGLPWRCLVVSVLCSLRWCRSSAG